MKDQKTGIDLEEKGKVIAIINALYPEAKIYIHGSRADGSWRMGSDLDIAVDIGKKMNWKDVLELQDVLNELQISFIVDLLDLHSVDEKLRNIIEKEKIVWKN